MKVNKMSNNNWFGPQLQKITIDGREYTYYIEYGVGEASIKVDGYWGYAYIDSFGIGSIEEAIRQHVSLMESDDDYDGEE
jgi:hypothetical protein